MARIANRIDVRINEKGTAEAVPYGESVIRLKPDSTSASA